MTYEKNLDRCDVRSLNQLEFGNFLIVYLTRILLKNSFENNKKCSILDEFLMNNNKLIKSQLMNFDEKALNLDYCNICLKTISLYIN